MTTPLNPRRLGWLLAALGLAIALLIALVSAGQAPMTLPLRDFVEYWAAGRLLAQGENPYDPARIAELERQAGRDEDAILMWNPPWTLPWVLPLGMFPVRTAHLGWLALHLALLVLCSELLWSFYGGPSSLRWLGAVIGLTFLPSMSALIVGQISPLVLLGAALFLVLIRRGHDGLAGAATTLLAIKPHLGYLFWLALLVWAIYQRRWRVLLGGAVTGLLLSGLVLFWRPAVFIDYLGTLGQAGKDRAAEAGMLAHYQSPTIGTLLRFVLGDSFAWQFVPMLPALAWFAWYLPRQLRTWDWAEQLPLLLLVSLLTAAYGAWLFDLVLLLVPIFAMAAGQAHAGTPTSRLISAGSLLAVNALALTLILCEVSYLHFIWMTPAVLVAYLALQPRDLTPALRHGEGEKEQAG